MHGVLNILKPPGMTSHDAVAFVRRTLQLKRVGHTGTLDPAAAGVLPICVGQATRLVEYLQAGTKEYIAEATFGMETDTCDAVGKTISEGDASAVNLESLRAALDGFRGEITQTPPLFSAIKKDGKKLYDLAREGFSDEDIEIPTRQVTISGLHVTQFFADPHRPRAILKIECSGGTYIRSLVRDIGRLLGCGATMTFLVRTRGGAFAIQDASTLEAIAADWQSALLPITEVLGWCAHQVVEDDDAIAAFAHGKIAPLNYLKPQLTEYSTDNEAYKWRRTKAWQGGHGGDTSHIAVINKSKTQAAIASPIEGDVTLFKPDKVFFLDAD